MTCILMFCFIQKTAGSSSNVLKGYNGRAALLFLELDPSSEGMVCSRL